MKQLEYIKKVLEFQKTTETSAMYNIVPYPFSNNEYYLNDFDINQCSEILQHIEKVEKFTDKVKNATICFSKGNDKTETLILVEQKGLNKHRAIDGYFEHPECKVDKKYIEKDFWNIEFNEFKSFHLSVLKNYILELSFENFNKMANYLFNHKLLIFENGMFTDPKTIKFQFVCWEQIIQLDFDNWLHEVKGFQRIPGVSHDGYLTMNNMYDFAKWYNENKQLQEKNKKEFRQIELKKVGLINDVVQLESDFDTSDKTNPLIFDIDLITGIHNIFRTFLFETIDIDNFKNCFRVNPISIKKRNGITVSELSYFFSKIEHLQTGVSNFGEWMGYHIKGNYGNKKNEFIRIETDAMEMKRNGFSLTTPQQKAIENKQKIDTLFNRILSN